MTNVSSALWRGARGYFVTEGPTGKIEVDTFACQHCGKQTFCCDPITKKPKKAEDCGGICNNCKGNICPKCVNNGRCIPLERAIQMMEERGRRYQEYGF